MMITIRDVQDPNVVLKIDTDDPLDQDLIAVQLTSRRGYGWFNRTDIIRALIALGEREVE